MSLLLYAQCPISSQSLFSRPWFSSWWSLVALNIVESVPGVVPLKLFMWDILGSSEYDWNDVPLLCEHNIIKVVHNHPSALQTRGLLEKASAYESLAFLDYSVCYCSISVCNGFLVYLCFSPSFASFSIVYLQKSFPIASNKEWKGCVAFHRSAVIDNKTSN